MPSVYDGPLLDASIETLPVQVGGKTLELKALVAELFKAPPPERFILEAAKDAVAGGVDLLKADARWRNIIAHLEQADWSASAIAAALARFSYHNDYGYPAVLTTAAALAGATPARLLEMCDALLRADGKDWECPGLGEAGLLALVRSGDALPARFDSALFMTEWRIVTELVSSVPAKRRDKLLEERFALIESGMQSLNQLVAVRSALTSKHRQRLDGLVDALRQKETKTKWDADTIARADGEAVPGQTRGADGLTDSVRRALELLKVGQVQQGRLADLAELAQARAGLSVRVDAPELADVAAWTSASVARRTKIAKAIEKAASAYELRFEKFEAHAIPLAVFVHRATKIRMCLIPGGTFHRGFSKAEEKQIRDAASAAGGVDADYENFGVLLENMATMRPSKAVRVGPVLLARAPTEPVEPAELPALIAALPFRLPSEAEHEHAQRGLAESALGWLGDSLPDEAWFKRAYNKKRMNDFGLRLLGFNPEVCGDAFSPDHKRASKEGAPRKGSGPRTVRGGAGMLYPWQGSGEWHFVLNAFRSASDDWEFHLSHRPALGIVLT